MNQLVVALFLTTLLISACCTQRGNIRAAEKKQDCELKKDSVDFGSGITVYDSDKLCLDTVFTYDFLETQNIKRQKVDFTKQSDSVIVNWNNNQRSVFIFDESVSLWRNNNKISIIKNEHFSVESVFMITIADEQYLALYLFQHEISNSNPSYKIIVLNSKNQLVQYIANDNQFSPSHGCFCDINLDNKLDYAEMDRNAGMIKFYTLNNWLFLEKQTIKIHSLMDNIYVMEK